MIDITNLQEGTQWACTAEKFIRSAVTLICLAQEDEHKHRRDDLMQGAYAAADDALQILGDAINALERAEKENRGEYIHLSGGAS